MKTKYFPYIIFQCSWGIIQTLAELIMCLISYGEKHMFYKGSIATFWKRPYGISFGLFIFIPPQARFYNADKYHFSDDEICERLVVHEYGHTIQSLILGPLYFLIVGLPSVIWGMQGNIMTEFIMVRHGEPDYSLVENWARIAVAKNFAPLTDKGVSQIKETIEVLREEKAQIILSSPFTRCMQGACMMSKELGLDVKVEHALYEWQLDKTHSVRAKLREKLLLWQFNHRKWNRFSKWEHPDTVKERVLQVFDKYLSYDKVIVSCHAMMILYTLGDEVPTQYGQIRRIRYDGKTLQEVE